MLTNPPVRQGLWASVLLVGVGFTAYAQPAPADIPGLLGQLRVDIDLEQVLGAGFKPGYGNSTYKESFSGGANPCASAVEFKSKKVASSGDYALHLTAIEGRCPHPKDAECGPILPGLTCEPTLTQAQADLTADPAVTRLEKGSNLYNETLDFVYQRSDGKRLSVQLRFRPNFKRGKPVKKQPTKLVAYRYE